MRDEINLSVIFYCEGALDYFKNKDIKEVRKIAYEIAIKGMWGIKYESKYRLKSIPNKDFSGLQILSYMFVAFKIIDPDVDIGIDLNKEYEIANKKIA